MTSKIEMAHNSFQIIGELFEKMGDHNYGIILIPFLNNIPRKLPLVE